jgi:hypothetical protein
MALGLDPVPVSVAGPVMAQALDLSWENDRLRVVDMINKYRSLLYTNYDKFKLFDNVFHCICISDFKQPCQPVCDGYQGFTLPEDVLSVEAVYDYGSPMLLRSRWRESHVGIGVASSGRIETVEMAETFATERDLQEISKLKIFAENDNDNGKKVVIDVVDFRDQRRRLCFTLLGDGFAVSAIKVKKIISVSLPSGREGGLLLTQANGYELSNYDPWETVPSYRRFRVNTQNCPSSVLVQGTKRFRNIYFDYDIVEVGNRLVIESAGRYFKYTEGTKDQSEIKTGEYHLAKMKAYLVGEIARHRGNNIQDGSPFKGVSITRKKTLPGYKK